MTPAAVAHLVKRFALAMSLTLAVVEAAADCAPVQAADKSLDESFLAGLRQRRLFDLAERHCAWRWSDRSLAATPRGEIAVEWIRTLTEHARNAPTEERVAFVKQAQDVAAQFEADFPEHSLVFLVQTQAALADATLGELVRLEAEVAVDSGVRMEEARKQSRAAARRLEQVDRRLTEFLPQRFRKPAAGDELGADELAALQHQVRLQAARAQRNLALAYDAASDDRIAALARGGQLLDASLRQIAPEMPLFAPICLELAAQQRLLGKTDAARETLGRLATAALTPDQQLAQRTETVRLALALQRLDDAERLAAVDARNRGPAEADWDFCRLEVLLARWSDLTSRKQDAAEVQRQALTLLDEIERDHGPFWKLRGDLSLVRFGGASGTRNADLVARAADSLVAQGRWDEALAAYDDALQQAREAKQADSQFTLGFKAGLLQQKREQHEDAAERLHAASLAAPARPQAAAAHLAATWNLAQAMRRDPTAAEGDLGERYEAWLREHAELWPKDESSNEARVWLGNWLQAAGRAREAAVVFREVAAASPQALVAWRGSLRASLLTLEDRTLAADAREPFAQATLTWLEAVEPPQEPTPDDALQLTALRVRCWALIAGRTAEARAALASLAESPPAVRAALVDWLRAIRPTFEPERRRECAELTLAVLESLSGAALEALTPETRRRLEVARAESLAAMSRREEAIEAYRQLSASEPQNGELQQALAELYEAGDAAADWQAALDQWRRIAAKSPPRSPRWFRAKLGVAAAMIRLGQREEAAKFIRFLQTAPPGLAGTPWAAEFEKLLPP
ncbi:MAG: hypothetical protein U0939_02700 [Pirellulales bacterium]